MLDMKRIDVGEFERIMSLMEGKTISISFVKDGMCDGAYTWENFGFKKGLSEAWYYGDRGDLLDHIIPLADIKELRSFEGLNFEEQIEIDLFNGRTFIIQHE